MSFNFALPTDVVSKDQEGYSTAARRWSRNGPPPALGERVVVSMNSLGEGVVRGYGLSRGEGCEYLYLKVSLYAPPEWYVKQNEGNQVAIIFGAELADAPPASAPAHNYGQDAPDKGLHVNESAFDHYQRQREAESKDYQAAVEEARHSQYPGLMKVSARRYVVVQVIGSGRSGGRKARISYRAATKPLPYGLADLARAILTGELDNTMEGRDATLNGGIRRTWANKNIEQAKAAIIGADY